MLGEFVTAAHCAELVREARAQASPWLQFETEAFAESYNRRPFVVRHRLTEHPLFTLENLFTLCRRLPEAQVRYRYGIVPPDAHFDSSLERFRRDLTLADVIDHFEERQAYIAIYNPEKDPAYRPMLEGLLGEIAAQTQSLDPDINWYSTYIFITAQHSVTPYHMDREMNFLLQVRGTKNVRLWDPADVEIMTQAQKDQLFGGRGEDRRPTYKPFFEQKAMIFELSPGVGVHHPFIAPHLVTTGPELSVSLAFTFRSKKSDVSSNAHRFNYLLRKFGLNPASVGARPGCDRIKAEVVRLALSGRNLLKRTAKGAA